MSVRVQRLPYHEDSAALFAAVRHLPWPVFLDSARPMVAQGRYDIIAAAPFQTLVTQGENTEIRHAGGLEQSSDDPFELLRKRLACAPQTVVQGLPFCGGAIGYFGYDLARRIECLPQLAQADDPMPELAVGLYDWALVVDHAQRCSRLVGQGRDPATAANWRHWVQAFSQPAVVREQPFRLCTPVRSNLSRLEYQARFERIQSYILEGDCYQVNFAQRFQAEAKGDPWTAYQRLRKINPAPYSAFLEIPQGSVLCSSPERFLRLREQRVQTCPIKGTVSRRADPLADRRMAEQLAASTKDRAENLMIVDLMRNDLGKVCQTGSVEVTGLFNIESFARVHHYGQYHRGQAGARRGRDQSAAGLFSRRLDHGRAQITGDGDYRRTGRSAARASIAAPSDISVSMATMDTNIAIRTLTMAQDRLRFWAGGGIVSDSNSEAEYQERPSTKRRLFSRCLIQQRAENALATMPIHLMGQVQPRNRT